MKSAFMSRGAQLCLLVMLLLPACDIISPGDESEDEGSNETPGDINDGGSSSSSEPSQFTFQYMQPDWMNGYFVVKALKNQQEVYAWMRDFQSGDELMAAFSWSDLQWRVLSDLEGYTLKDFAVSRSGQAIGSGSAGDDMLVIKNIPGERKNELAWLLNGSIINTDRIFNPVEQVILPPGSGFDSYLVVDEYGGVYRAGNNAGEWIEVTVPGTDHNYFSTVFPGNIGTNIGYGIGSSGGSALISGSTLSVLQSSDGAFQTPRTYALDWVNNQTFLAAPRMIYKHDNTGASPVVVPVHDPYEGTFAASPPPDYPTISSTNPIDFEASQLYTRFGKVIDPLTNSVRTFLTLRPIVTEEDAAAKMSAWDQLYFATHLFREPLRPGFLYYNRGYFDSNSADEPGGWLYYQINPAAVAQGSYVDPWREYCPPEVCSVSKTEAESGMP